jgi:hypothetical protein
MRFPPGRADPFAAFDDDIVPFRPPDVQLEGILIADDLVPIPDEKEREEKQADPETITTFGEMTRPTSAGYLDPLAYTQRTPWGLLFYNNAIPALCSICALVKHRFLRLRCDHIICACCVRKINRDVALIKCPYCRICIVPVGNADWINPISLTQTAVGLRLVPRFANDNFAWALNDHVAFPADPFFNPDVNAEYDSADDMEMDDNVAPVMPRPRPNRLLPGHDPAVPVMPFVAPAPVVPVPFVPAVLPAPLAPPIVPLAPPVVPIGILAFGGGAPQVYGPIPMPLPALGINIIPLPLVPPPIVPPIVPALPPMPPPFVPPAMALPAAVLAIHGRWLLKHEEYVTLVTGLWGQKVMKLRSETDLILSRLKTLMGSEYAEFRLASECPGWPNFGVQVFHQLAGVPTDDRDFRSGLLPTAGEFQTIFVEYYRRIVCLERLATSYRSATTANDPHDEKFHWWDVWRKRLTVYELRFWNASKLPLERLEVYEQLQPFSLYADPGLFYQILSLLAYCFYTFVFVVFAEEYFKRFLKSHIDPYVITVLKVAGTQLLHWSQYDGIASAFIVIATLFLPAFLLALYETRQTMTKHWFLSILGRSLAHAFLLDLPFMDSLMLHALWNIVFFRYPEFQLRVRFVVSRLTPVVMDVCCDDHGVKADVVQPAFQVTWGEPECKPKFGARMHWFIRCYDSTCYLATVFRQCIHNEIISIKARVGKLLPQHAPAVVPIVTATWLNCENIVLPHMLALIDAVVHPTRWLKWVRRFEPRKREMLNRIYYQGSYGYSNCADSFIKREVAIKRAEAVYHTLKTPLYRMDVMFQVAQVVGDVLIKAPRWIQGCKPDLSVDVGPFCHKLAKHVRRGLSPGDEDNPFYYTPAQIRSGKQVVYTCGMNAEQVGAAYRGAIDVISGMCEPGERVVVIEDDQSKFDEHITRAAFHFAERFYGAKLPSDVARKLRRDISRGISKLGTRYRVPYTVQSGVPDTSIIDSIINAAMKYFIHQIGRKWISLILGDDSVTVTTDWEINFLGGILAMQAIYANFGMEVEIQLRLDPCDAEFCSGRFYPVGDTFVLMPKIGKLLAKLAADMKDRNGPNQLAWLRGISMTLSEFGRVDPLCKTLALSIFRFTGRGRVIRERDNPYKYPVTQHHVVTEANVDDYYDRFYSMNRNAFLSCIDTLSHKFELGIVYDNPFLAEMVRIDIL